MREDIQRLVNRIKEWREDDAQGYDTAIGLLCDAEQALRAQLRRDKRNTKRRAMKTRGSA